MKLALHRSIIFWTGILMVTFTCWSWWDSRRAASYVILDRHAAFSDRGELSVSNNFPSGMRKLERKLHIHGPDAEPGVPFFPPLLFLRGGGEGGEVQPLPGEGRHETAIRFMEASPKDLWLLIIPYWLLLVSVALPWTGLLIWRARRRGRAPVTPA